MILIIWNFRRSFGISFLTNSDIHFVWPQFLIDQSQNCYYMDHVLEFISPVLEILEIEVFNILYNPGNTGGRRAAPGVRLRGLGFFLEHGSCNFRISWKYWNCYFYVILRFFQKRCAPKFHAEPTDQ